jgi:hypothetical protein
MNAKQSDPVVDEIREVRHRISKRFDHDPEKLVAYCMELQQRYRDPLIESPLPREQKDQSAA